MSIDTNYEIYPLVIFVVETDNNESLQYYMEKLYDQLGCNGSESLCFINDW